MKTLVIASAALFGMVPGFHAMAAEKITSADGLQRMRGAPLEEVLEVFTGEDYLVKVPDNPRGVVNFRVVSVVDKAGAVLSARLEEAREPLMKLLEIESPEVRARALGVLSQCDLEQLVSLRPKVLPMLNDPLRAVRRNAAELLAKVKDESVEIALIGMLGRREPLKGDGDEYSEISRVIEILCDKPVSEDRVILELIPWLDESKANSWVVLSIVRGTAPFSRVGPHASRLMERDWAILSTTQDDGGLTYFIGQAWAGDHPLSLPYLRRASEIAHDGARRCAVHALLRHRDFDAQKEAAVIDGLREDRSGLVRWAVVSGLCFRDELPVRLQLAKALSFMETDPEVEARIAAAKSIFARFLRVPHAELDGLLTDPSLAIADRMLAALKGEELGHPIALCTGALSGNWGGVGRDGEVKVAIAWWEDVKKGKVSRLEPKPSVPTRLNERLGWKDGVPPPPVK